MKKAMPILISLIMIFSVFAGCGGRPAPAAELSSEAESVSTDSAPGAPELTPSPDGASSAELRVDAPERSRLNAHDVKAVLQFLNKADHFGNVNGRRLNPGYSSSDPSTWCFLSGGVVRPAAVWDEEGYLTEFAVIAEDAELEGNIDLSDCERLERVEVSYQKLGHLSLSGCPLGRGVSVYGTELYGIHPRPLVTPLLEIRDSRMRHISWKAVPNEANGYYCDFELDLDTDMRGFVEILSGDEAGRPRIFIKAVPAEPDKGARFLGWYDANGALVSESAEFELTSLGTEKGLSGRFSLTASFEDASALVPDALNEHEYSVLRAFFEQKDENGVTNGSKCFPGYDPDDPSTWNDGSANSDSRVFWNENGRVREIALKNSGDAPVRLVGTLDLEGFDELTGLFVFNTSIGGLELPELPFSAKRNNSCVSVNMAEGEVRLVGGYAEKIFLRSASHVYCSVTGEAESDLSVLPSFTVDISVEGGGFAGVSAYDDENYYVVRLTAEPAEGGSFLGWFDENGALVSSDPDFELFGEETGQSADGAHAVFRYTARFS